MKIFTDKNIKNLFLVMLCCLLGFLLVSITFLFLACPSRAVWILGAALVMAILMFFFCFRYFIWQNHIIEQAADQIIKYRTGDKNARIDCDKEGELYKFFHNVNSLATVLNAHIENEAKAREFLKETISDISHQLKTPLAALSVYNGILEEELAGQNPAANFIALSEKEIDRIDVLVQNLLKITKLDAGAIVIEKQAENLADILSEIMVQFSFRAEREEKNLIFTGDKDIVLSCDRDWLLEAVGNIVKNAFDHTNAGDSISIEQKKLPSAIQIIIKDSGHGIHPDDIYHIFKRFYRSRFSQDTQGIGLGLALAKTIIEAQNGSIAVDSQLGQGSTFTISFFIPTEL
jgi:signal transduction histidine kinase